MVSPAMAVVLPSVLEIIKSATLSVLVTLQLNTDECCTLAAGIVTVLPEKVATLVAGLVLPSCAFPALASRQLAAVNCQAGLGCVSVKVTATPSVVMAILVNAATVVLLPLAVVGMFVSAAGTPLVPEKPKLSVPTPPTRVLLMLIVGLSSSRIV